MFELFFLAGLVALVVWLIRGKKTVVIDEPVIVQEFGVYHATIAPQFVRSQYLIAQIAMQFQPADRSDITTQCFDLHDAGVHYLMAVTRRAGVLYFQVIGAEPEGVSGLRHFSEQVLLYHPLTLPLNDPADLIDAVHAAAFSLKIDGLHLQ
jgi:hypothetical protein